MCIIADDRNVISIYEYWYNPHELENVTFV